MDSEIVEKVAQAVQDNLASGSQEDIFQIARAAIAAYEAAKREATPSEAASDAGLNWAKPL